MTFIQRENGESLAMHLHRNAAVIGADRRQTAILREAAAMSLPQRSRKDRAQAGLMAEQVRDELKASLDAVMYAAQARGERIEPFNDAGAVQLRDRDGLVALHLSGALTEHHYNTGLEYRRLFETCGHADVGSQLGQLSGQPSAARTDVKSLHLRRLDSVLAGAKLAAADAAVGLEGVDLLRSVAGLGRSLTARGMSGYERRRRKALLLSALETVRLSFAETGGLRIRGT